VRSCAACRARAPRDALLRFALDGGRVVVDLDKRLGGRGLSLGPSPVCLAEAQRRGVFMRAWKVGVSPEDVRVLALEVRARLAERLGHWLADGHRRGALVPAERLALPEGLRPLWDDERLADVVGDVPPVRALTPRAERRLALLTRAVSQFTFQGAGDKKRRPEPADLCVALAPEVGRAGSAGRPAEPGLPATMDPSTGSSLSVLTPPAPLSARPSASDLAGPGGISAEEAHGRLPGHPSGGSE